MKRFRYYKLLVLKLFLANFCYWHLYPKIIQSPENLVPPSEILCQTTHSHSPFFFDLCMRHYVHVIVKACGHFVIKNTNKIKVSSLLWTKTHPVNRRELESFNKLNGSAFEYVRLDLVHSVSYAKELFSGFFFWFIKTISDNHSPILLSIG